MTEMIRSYDGGGIVQSHAPAVRETNLPTAVETLRAWASVYQEVAQFVAPLVATAFCPVAFQPKYDPRATAAQIAAADELAVASATAAVIYGAGLGLDPLTALQSVYVVGGRPGLYAEVMVAIVVAAGHEVWTEDVTDTRAIVCGRRAGSAATERVIVTMDAAKKAGWTRNAKYASEPAVMLYARAASRVCRRIAPDALRGISASVEELQDTEAAPITGRTTVRRAEVAPLAIEAAENDEAAPVIGAATARVSKRRTTPAASAPQELPPLPGEDDPEPEPEPATVTGELITAAQMKKLHALFTQCEIKARDDALAFAHDVTGRAVESTKELTKLEASAVIDALDVLAAARTGIADGANSGTTDAQAQTS